VWAFVVFFVVEVVAVWAADFHDFFDYFAFSYYGCGFFRLCLRGLSKESVKADYDGENYENEDQEKY